jgi:hypothetical protein
VIVFLAYLLFTWNWRRLARAEILRALPFAILACALVAVPWHHAMLARHGFPFWNELYGDNHWRRLVTGRHGDRGSFEYFIRELGYGLFPVDRTRALGAGVGGDALFRRRADGEPPRQSRRRTSVGTSVVRRHLVRGGLRLGVVLDDQVPPLHPARPARAGHGGRLFSRRCAHREARQIDLLAVLAGTPLLALVAFDLTSAQKSAQHFIWLFSYDYVNTPQGRPGRPT